MIKRAPQVMCLAVDPNEHLVQVPALVRIKTTMNPSFPDLCGEHRPEPVPPEPDRLMADVDAPFEQKVFDLAERQWIPDVDHHRQADHLR